MSESNNPLFENERDFLERQKEEYRSALKGDVEQIKTQGQEIGKKAAIAGGVVLAGFLLRRMFSSDKKKSKALKGKKKKNTDTLDPEAHYVQAEYRADNSYIPAAEPVYYPPQHTATQQTSIAKSFMNSELVQLITHQLAALLMVYITKKVEEYINSVSKNNDIAPIPIEVTEEETTEYIYPEEDAI